MNIDTGVRIFMTIVLSSIAISFLFMGKGPSTKVKQMRNGWVKWATNEDGSLKKYTKITLIFVFVLLIIFVWMVPSNPRY